MKHILSIGIALIVLVNVMELFPGTQAPLPEKESYFSASLIQSQFTNGQKERAENNNDPLLLNLLELYVEQERDLPKAAAVIDKTQHTPANQELLKLYEAKILSRSLQFETAVQLLDQINHEELVLMKAAVLIALEEREQATAYLHQLVEEHPDPVVTSTALALLNTYRNYDLHRDTDVSYLWTLFAQQLGKIGEFEISLYLCNKAITNNSDYRDAWFMKGFNEFQLKRFQDAETSLLKAHQLDPGNSQLQYLLGLTYFELKNPELSTQYLLYAQENETTYSSIIFEKLAENAISTKDYPLGAHYYETLLKQDPNSKQVLSRLIGLYGEQLDQAPQALYYAQKLLELAPHDANSYELMSWVYGKMGNLEKAAEYLTLSKQFK